MGTGTRSRSASRERHHSRRHSRRHHHHHASSSRRSRSRSRDRHSRRSRRSRSRSLSRSASRERHSRRHRHRPRSERHSRKRSRDGSERGGERKRAKDAPLEPQEAVATRDDGAQEEEAPPAAGVEQPAAGVEQPADASSSSETAEAATAPGVDAENSNSSNSISSKESNAGATPASSAKAAVDPLAVATSARKLIAEAKASLLPRDDDDDARAVAAAPAVDVSAIKLDILKALAEARSTIAEIKSEAPAFDKAARTTDVNAEPGATVATDACDATSNKTTEAETLSASSGPAEAVDEFDMFSVAELGDDDDDAAMPSSLGASALAVTEASMQANCDDAEGYYTTTVGEVLHGSYRVLGVVGKGVFSTVLRCARATASGAAAATAAAPPDAVAVKLIRNNEVMRDAAQMEIRLLKELSARDPRDKKHCVRLLDTFEHRGHVALVFESMQMNVREAMKKFGGKGGISIQAVRVFSKHLLIALSHLEACAVVHADDDQAGKVPNKMIRKHRQAYIEQFEMEPHFTEDLKFCSREADRVTGKPVLRLLDTVKAKNDLGSSLAAAKSSTDDRKLVLELRNLLERMFVLDPAKRISVRDALAHPFVKTS
ncbi:hypothetical protein PybrP1_006011 [[Pythium] brassicae (nom. inval.)]|nr:hypothetical protein PybrP1_006011 [[Pythium] brassicae (nom. inval.)]